MDVDTISASVHRQGTFDTDPTQTLVDSTGAVKRGSIELPTIGGTPQIKAFKSKQSQLSIDSQNIDDVSEFLKTLKSTAKISGVKSQSFKFTATIDTHKHSLKEVKQSRTNSQPSAALSKKIPDKLLIKSDSHQNVQLFGNSRFRPVHKNEQFSSSRTTNAKKSRSNPLKVPKEIDQPDVPNVFDIDREAAYEIVDSLITPTIQIPVIKQKPPRDTKMSKNQQTSGGGGRVIKSYEYIYAERKALLENEDAYKKRIKQLEDELYSLLKTTDDIRAENKLSSSKMNRIEEENRELKGNKRMQKFMREGTLSPRPDPETFEMESQMNKLKEQNRKLEEESRNLQQVAPGDDLFTLDQENAEMITKIIKLSQKIQDLEVENGKMKEEFGKEREILTAEVKKVNAKLKSEPKRTYGEKEHIVKLQTENQGLNTELAKLKEQSEKSNKLIMELEKERISLQSSITAVESEKLTELQYLKNEHAKIESVNESLKSAKQELESERNDLVSENKEFRTKLSKLEVSNKNIAESLAKQKTEVMELTNALKNNNGTENELQKERQEKKKLQKQCDQFQKNVETKNKEIAEIKIQKDKLESEKMVLKKEFETYKRSGETKSTDLGKLEDELKETKQKLQKEMDKQNKVLKDTEDLANELLGKKKELRKLQQRATKSKNDKDKAVAELETSNKEKESLKLEMASITIETEEPRKHGKLKSSDSGDKLNKLKKELSESKEDNVKLASELKTKKAECEDLTKQLLDLSLTMKNINITVKETESERKYWLVHKEKYSEIESSYKSLLEENKHLRTLTGRDDGWVSGLFGDKDVRTAEYVGSINARKVPRPQKKNRLILKPVDRSDKASKSMGDVIEEEERLSQKSTPSLPSIDELDNSRLTFGLGYRQIYRNKMKAVAKFKRT